MTSTEAAPTLRNPAPHRGFNAKAREVLLDPEPPVNRYGELVDDRSELNRFVSQDSIEREATTNFAANSTVCV